jgi:hypothetical protein
VRQSTMLWVISALTKFECSGKQTCTSGACETLSDMVGTYLTKRICGCKQRLIDDDERCVEAT